MARSRLEKIGTIFDRVSGLMKSGAIIPEDKPIWYDVYEAFPPKLEPRFDRPAPNIPIKSILYAEDVIRAKFHKEYKTLGAVNLLNHNYPTVSMRFLEVYGNLKKESNKGEDLYKEAIDVFNSKQTDSRFQTSSEDQTYESLASSFREAQKRPLQESSVNIKDLFKE